MDRQLMIVLLIAVAVGGLMYAFVYPYLSGDVRAQKRQALLAASSSDRKGSARGGAASDPAKRRKAIAESLKEIEEKNKVKKYDLEQRIEQAGLTISKQAFLMASVGFGLLFGLVLFAVNGQAIVGAGGVLTELWRDTACLLAPATRDDVRSALLSLRTAPLLTGYRGKASGNIDAVVDLVLTLQDAAVGSNLVEIEVNPVLVTVDGAVAVDALLIEEGDSRS